jgi:hypothetical protein
MREALRWLNRILQSVFVVAALLAFGTALALTVLRQTAC